MMTSAYSQPTVASRSSVCNDRPAGRLELGLERLDLLLELDQLDLQWRLARRLLAMTRHAAD